MAQTRIDIESESAVVGAVAPKFSPLTVAGECCANRNVAEN